jgi:hypothetical protein
LIGETRRRPNTVDPNWNNEIFQVMLNNVSDFVEGVEIEVWDKDYIIKGFRSFIHFIVFIDTNYDGCLLSRRSNDWTRIRAIGSTTASPTRCYLNNVIESWHEDSREYKQSPLHDSWPRKS